MPPNSHEASSGASTVSFIADLRRKCVAMNFRYPRAWVVFGVLAACGLGFAAGAGFLVPHEWFSQFQVASTHSASSNEHAGVEDDGDHAGHSHGMKSHPGHDDLTALGISTQAEQTIGLKVCRIELKPYQRSIIVPAMIVERPGRSVVRVTAPLSGIVTSIAVVRGEAVTAGQALITVRLTHEELVQAQSDLLRSLAELDVAERELKRLEPLAKDSLIPRKTVLEREYEQQKLEAVIKAQRQALSLHGLNEEQIASILADRELFRELTVSAPLHAKARADKSSADNKGKQPGERLWQVQELAVELGQHVEAGNLLCVLADHAELYIEGTAFEQDSREIERAVHDNSAVTAVIETFYRLSTREAYKSTCFCRRALRSLRRIASPAWSMTDCSRFAESRLSGGARDAQNSTSTPKG
jgi:cobalt-zinc-cadmium efflux system membrane fusion protein